jgi:hypothetical protein
VALTVTTGAIGDVIREYAEHAGDDQDVRAVLSRLAQDAGALDAIVAIAKEGGEVRQLLELCLRAAWELREYHAVLDQARARCESLRKHRESVDDLRRFITETADPYHPLVNAMPIPATEQERSDRIAAYPRAATAGLHEQRAAVLVPGSAEYFRDALDRLAALIELQQRAADTAPHDLAVSREAATLAAAEKAVIGRFAEQVAETFGRPHTARVATLAGAVLGIGEVEPSRVRDALSARARKVQ